MKDQERADRLAMAIEELIQGRQPRDLDDDPELNELLQIARIRLDAAQASARDGAEAERAVWEQITSRLNRLQEQDGIPNGLIDTSQDVGNLAANEEPGQSDIKELLDVISVRRQMALDAIAVSDTHRDAVWQRVQTRIQSGLTAKRGLFSNPFRRRDPQIESFAAAVDRLVLGEPIWEATDSKLEELIHLARVRQAIGQTAAATSRDYQGRLWARLRPRLMARLLGARIGSRRPAPSQSPATPEPVPATSTRRGAWPKLALAAGAAALVLAALGPIPTSGLANHPAAQLVRFLENHVGVSETGPPPIVPPPTEIVEGSDVTPQQASELLGLPLRQPSYLPPDFRQVSSRYYPRPISADAGGVFTLAYTETSSEAANPPTILIYQEHTSASTIAVQNGFAQDIVLPDGTNATYVEGSWQPSGSEIVWGEDGAQTLVIDAGGLRSIIHYTGHPKLNPAEFLAIASSMTADSTP